MYKIFEDLNFGAKEAVNYNQSATRYSWLRKLPRLFEIGRLTFALCTSQCNPS